MTVTERPSLHELSRRERDKIIEEIGEEAVESVPVEVVQFVVGEIDQSDNAERKAYDIAQRQVEELKEKNNERFILNPKRIIRTAWGFGATQRTLLNKARREIREANDVTVIDDEYSPEARRRYADLQFDQFFHGSDEAIDESAGEKREFFADDHEATVAAKELFREFSTTNMSDDEFNQRIQEVRTKMGEQLSDTAKGDVILDNYLEAAQAMRGRIEHDASIDRMLEGFKLARAEARSDSRTEVHRTRSDRLLDTWEESKIGSLIPSQVAAVGISVGSFVAVRGASTVARAAAFVGGGVVIGAVAGVREHAEITRQRARHEQEIFRGKEYTERTGREKELSEFEYRRFSAEGAIEGLDENTDMLLNGRFDHGTIEKVLDDLAEAQLLKTLSAERGIDLFSHGVSDDPTKHLQDRLDLARAQAELKMQLVQAIESGNSELLATLGITDLNAIDRASEFIASLLDARSEASRDTYLEAIDTQDAAFESYRRKESIKKGIKVGALSLVAGVAIQEAIAIASDNSSGLIEQAWGADNNSDAHNTMLGGLHSADQSTTEAITRELSPQEIADLRANGSTVIDHSAILARNFPTTESIGSYIDALPDGEMRHFSSVELYTNAQPYSDLNELDGQLSHGSNGMVSPWDTMNAKGSFNAGGSIDMDTGPNVFDIAIKQPDGTHLHKVFEYGQDVPKPWADMLYEKDDGTWGFKGDGYIAWGQTSGDHLDVAASIGGDGEDFQVTAVSTVEETISNYEVITPVETQTDFAPPVWMARTERLGNAKRPERYRYGYSGVSGGYGERRRDAELLDEMSKDWSPSIEQDASADLNPAEELNRYAALLERRRSKKELDGLKEKINNTPELKNVDANLETIVTVPVGAKFESENIFNTLSLYAKQEAESLQKTVIMLNVNWLDTIEVDAVAMEKVRKTLAEIERARQAFPELKIAVIQNIYEQARAEKTGGVIGYVAQDLMDTALLSIHEAQQNGAVSSDQSVLIQRHDADMLGMSHRHLASLQEAARENPETDLFKGSTKLDIKSAQNNPGWGVVSDIFNATSLWATQSGRVHTGGANFAVRSEILAAVGGINPEEGSGAGADDVNIGRKIELARSHGRRNRVSRKNDEYYQVGLSAPDTNRSVIKHVPGMVIDTNSSRFVPEYQKSADWGQVWNPGEGSFSKGSGGYGERTQHAKRTRRQGKQEKYGIFGTQDFDRLEKTISHELNYQDDVTRRRILSMFFRDAPGAYKIETSSSGRIDFSLTKAGRKFVRQRLGKRGQYATKKIVGTYGNETGATTLGQRAILA